MKEGPKKVYPMADVRAKGCRENENLRLVV